MTRMSIGGNSDNFQSSLATAGRPLSLAEIGPTCRSDEAFSAGSLSVSPATAAAIAATIRQVQEEEDAADVYARFGGVYDDDAAVAAVAASLLLESETSSVSVTVSNELDYSSYVHTRDADGDDARNSSDPPKPKVIN